ncbi:MAG TPA: tRNA (adenosine(37)-N6)-dimethylallyltransferase MiaA [Spirochaetota bacterium]|nr:tRNA (adenosine(37)-N6)-dimethylallyltransferase MiaA [Spirochaetota bacterium]
MVGGTGLYFNSLMRGMIDIPKVSDEIKKRVRERLLKRGQERFFEILKKIDFEYSLKIHPNDRQRTSRAIEVFLQTGNKFSSYLKRENIKNEIKYIKIGLIIDRQKLYDIINKRVDKMIENGLVEETKKILEMGYSKNCPALKGIGYKEIVDYLENRCSLDEAIYNIKKNTRHYAKRQITWFKSMNDIMWFSPDDEENIKKEIYRKIKEIKN